ncbi:hypothetical protein K503DRAFT_747250 [Rhizopogon vinicolor AM-OR11-026]|uniref:Tc1-like transposase DDE domain-containing protein n=1 Tax=Rhizopogon vinicolor AM-OR11-026 TaxID=1314800 RepID=A0A1B7MPM1_9AGAM|nr:hypothetical protein K503DRAFT_747250 [Rhizopogon vinicolor AM-OR11-026]
MAFPVERSAGGIRWLQIELNIKKKMKTSDKPQVAFMRQWCAPKASASGTSHDAQPAGSLDSDTVRQLQPGGIAIDFAGYLSDESKDNSSDDSDSDEDTHKCLPAVPPLKRRKLDIPFRTQRKLDKERREDERRTALEAIEKLLQSKKTAFISGPSGLQAKRARTIQSHLALIVKRGHSSIVAEIIENTGHLCIFLPKFHCELNFVEYFWGKVKKYFRDNCDGTFNTLKTNTPLAMQSVQLSTIRLWEHRMHHWMEVYRTGLNTKDAQFRVRQFSSTKYKSYRRVPEMLARASD